MTPFIVFARYAPSECFVPLIRGTFQLCRGCGKRPLYAPRAYVVYQGVLAQCGYVPVFQSTKTPEPYINMPGYSYYNNSKSENAISAEWGGRYPATHVARILKIPSGFVRDCCRFANHGEWHHTSNHYNRTKYYDTFDIQCWMANDIAVIKCAGGRYEEMLAAWKKWWTEKNKRQVIYRDVKVTWPKWNGSPKHRRPKIKTLEGASVIDSGTPMVRIQHPSLAKGMRKGRRTRGFKLTKNGVRIFL